MKLKEKHRNLAILPLCWKSRALGPQLASPGGALRVKISRGARLEVQNGTQQDLNEIIDLVNLGGKKIVYMLKMGGFEMGPNKIWIKW